MGVPTYDLEAVGWTNIISVGFYDGYSYHEFLKENEADDILWRFLCFLKEHFSGYRIAAHYAARFDNKFILKSLHTHEEAVKLEAGLAMLTWVEPNIKFEDSYLLVPFSLRKAAKMFGLEDKGTWDHELGLKPWEMGERLEAFRSYQKLDCVLLSELLTRVCEAVGWNFDVTPSISLATTSVKAFSKLFVDLTTIQSNEEFESFIREATYGARNEVYKRYGEHIRHYDINSMYMSCYDVPVPIGKMTWARPNLDNGTLVEATVKVPKDWYVGPLPYRHKGHLIFPVGEFSGKWDGVELRNAASLGVDIKIRRQLNCEEAPILDEFGKVTLRLKSGKLGQFWKLFGVSLAGKLGQTRWRDVTQHASTIKDFTGYTPIDRDEIYFNTQRYIKGRTPYIKPAIAMRIRAETRVRHLRYLLEAHKAGEIFYSDTDSVFTTAHLPFSDKPGELALVNEVDRGYFIRQKLYGYIANGKLTQKSSGYKDTRLSEDDFKELLAGGTVETIIGDLPKYPQLIKGADLTRIKRSRVLSGFLSNNRTEVGSDTKPICLP